MHSILIVDDDPQFRRFCRTSLDGRGYLISEAANGAEALSAVRAAIVDLIVLDLSMPDMDGFEFLKAVRLERRDLRVLVMSGFMGGTMLPAAKHMGGTETIAKPFAPETLVSIVQTILQSAASQ
jgi:CheY-like chemotaxis protein